jgi:hypothetical protein
MSATRRGAVRREQDETCGYGCTCPVWWWSPGDSLAGLEDFGGPAVAHHHDGCPAAHDGAECPAKLEQEGLFDGEARDRSDA